MLSNHILMTAFEMEDSIFSEYAKKEIINGFFQKPIRLTKLVEEVHTQLHSYEVQKTYHSQPSPCLMREMPRKKVI
jgi:hypothetical protein